MRHRNSRSYPDPASSLPSVPFLELDLPSLTFPKLDGCFPLVALRTLTGGDGMLAAPTTDLSYAPAAPWWWRAS
jgi:hypothetical protein